MGFSQALSGLNAAKSNLDVLGNNIANSQTVGFKSSNTQFADVFANADVGLGTQVSAVLQDFSAGNLEATDRELDLAISGNGFFRFEQGGEAVYSRNGQLTMDADGYLVNAQGAKVMGYGLSDPDDPFSEMVAGGQPEVLNVPGDIMPASATNQVDAVYNLDASIDETNNAIKETAKVQTAGGEQELDYHYSNSFTVYDSLGNPRNVTAYYEKTGQNTWQGKVAIDGYYDASGENDFSINFAEGGSLLTGEDGIIGVAGNAGTGRAANITFEADELGGEAADLNFEMALAGTTQFANDSTASSLTQNGYTSGAMVGITVEDDGTIMRNFANEESVAAGQIAMASFVNPEGLQAAGDNAWVATTASGPELVGKPGEGVLGSISSGAVETSNVDMASELVDMIVAQRAYQANSQTIKIEDELLQSAVNLR
ncbi:flagellar hook protein FlgE [Halomonas sp. YLGW01]|uniref:flagellar hook protein FlgE n=1 Tax=Halomonas sp. YLGW01 TaxID=2773308 RepID=UPI0017850820|nr:flagellar hook protein FlgE [Halomonas sp. YLGW01]